MRRRPEFLRGPAPLRRRAAAGAALLAAMLAGCSSGPRPAPEPPTLATLADRKVAVEPDRGVAGDEAAAARAYRDFLAAAPREPQRQEARRRLGDLEMDRVDAQIAAGERAGTAGDYQAAIAHYQEFLTAYPQAPGNDRVLYQLARAHELGGDLPASLALLTQLVQTYPNTPLRAEAQFRRGELLFTLRDYAAAEEAYRQTMAAGPRGTFHERSLFMHGWSLFKQGRLEDGLASFFGVLDGRLGALGADQDEAPIDRLPGLSRADRELVEDTFRVVSISLANLKGADSIPPYIDSELRRRYEFRVYEQLGELYVRQERVKDAADAFAAFAQRRPLHPQAPQMQARVVDIYAQGGLPSMALTAKKQYVEAYGVGSDYQRANPAGWARSEPLVRTHLEELARHHHAAAQGSHKREDVREAVHWYRQYLTSFPRDPQAAQNNFLLAELLYEDAQFAAAAAEYEKTAYGYPPHDRRADAGYAALLAYAQQQKQPGADLPALQRSAVDGALRFAQTFPQDARVGPVLTHAAETLYALDDRERAAAVAHQVLALQPPAAAGERRVAWTVLAHVAFERGAFAEAEGDYAQVLALLPAQDAARAGLAERLAASIYKQGEAALAQGALREAVGHFDRVGSAAPGAGSAAAAQYDAAAALLALKDWDGAARRLEDFRRRHPQHPLQGEVAAKLAVAYVEQGSWTQAAAEFERIAGSSADPQLARAGLWQAAEMYEKAGARPPAARAYERYLKQYPAPLDPALEARWRLAGLARADGNAARATALLRELQKADLAAGGARSERGRYLGGMATLALAQPLVDGYRQVALVEPLARQLKLKKAKMEQALTAFSAAADYGVAEVTTRATYETAEIYRDFGRALLDSQRPKGLKKDEREQYDVLLEEQAFPFEEKAIELHEVNARRTAQGVYTDAVRDSYAALGRLRPARYGKAERADEVIDAVR